MLLQSHATKLPSNGKGVMPPWPTLNAGGHDQEALGCPRPRGGIDCMVIFVDACAVCAPVEGLGGPARVSSREPPARPSAWPVAPPRARRVGTPGHVRRARIASILILMNAHAAHARAKRPRALHGSSSRIPPHAGQVRPTTSAGTGREAGGARLPKVEEGESRPHRRLRGDGSAKRRPPFLLNEQNELLWPNELGNHADARARAWRAAAALPRAYRGSALLRYQQLRTRGAPPVQLALLAAKDSSDTAASATQPTSPSLQKPEKAWVVRTWEYIKHEARHYYMGTVLLVKDVRTAVPLLQRVLLGHDLSRR
ncbi:hypothetical protein T492DRAFT_834650 [Pavlovales sp. CCMP2436]|nr:hypothetical protein T492DRAFT_834650 [Pavlovales sp. CCMP2436]